MWHSQPSASTLKANLRTISSHNECYFTDMPPKTIEEVYDYAGVPVDAQKYLKARGIQSLMLLARMAPDVDR